MGVVNLLRFSCCLLLLLNASSRKGYDAGYAALWAKYVISSTRTSPSPARMYNGQKFPSDA